MSGALTTPVITKSFLSIWTASQLYTLFCEALSYGRQSVRIIYNTIAFQSNMKISFMLKDVFFYIICKNVCNKYIEHYTDKSVIA